MNVALRTPGTTREQFFDRVQHQRERHEFDGVQPAAMVRVTGNHGGIAQDIYAAPRSRSWATGRRVLGPDAGVATVGNAVRYPDALATCTEPPGTGPPIPGVIEVLSPSSGQTDRIAKVREYGAVASIRRRVIPEYAGPGLTVLERSREGQPWTASTPLPGDTLPMPEVGTEVPVDEFHEDVDLPGA